MRYTTGELAKLCGVSVRTVQYYDERRILAPKELSEGGRRLYGEEDAKRLELICFLRELGLSISAIAELLSDESSEDTVSLLLDRQKEKLLGELSECKEKLDRIEAVRRTVKRCESQSLEAVGDAAIAVRQRKKLTRVRLLALAAGLPLSVWQWASIVLWIAFGLFWPFVLWCPLALLYGICFSVAYFKRVAYICPVCHAVFKPRFWRAFWAGHTSTLRRLRCPGCQKKSYCLEIYDEERVTTHGKAT